MIERLTAATASMDVTIASANLTLDAMALLDGLDDDAPDMVGQYRATLAKAIDALDGLSLDAQSRSRIAVSLLDALEAFETSNQEDCPFSHVSNAIRCEGV
jgi:hypothetical protein